ncbi:Spike glycoprotein, partial [Dissostichus eleginoides]
GEFPYSAATVAGSEWARMGWERRWGYPPRTHLQPCHTHPAFHMVRPPNGFNTCPIATALPSNQRAAPWKPPCLPTLSSSPPCNLTNHHRRPSNCFCPTEPAPATAFDSQSVQVHF